ncbi:MAG: phosphatidylinositol-specific phospholipase C1-like protein [Planctomycetota bacterium]|jgi:hypothetical protein
MYPFRFLALLTLALLAGSNCPLHAQEIQPGDEQLRLNQIQVIGTHNSYHLAPTPKVMELIAISGAETARGIDYTHPPLPSQFSELGIRQIELDLFADPHGGRYSSPGVWKLLGAPVEDERMKFDFAEVMQRPGFKVIHAPGFDYATHVPTLEGALQQVVRWSESHPDHLPILVLLELKDSAPPLSGVKPHPFDASSLDELDRVVLSTVPEQRRWIPDTIRGKHTTLRDAVMREGWPTLMESRGKILFALDNTNGLRDLYLKDHPGLEGRAMFASVAADHPAAAWMKINNPIGDFDRIQSAVKQGFLVRTRADADTRQARSGDTKMRDAAMASGAQFISTDYPVRDDRFTDYQVQWPDRAVYRRNPVALPPIGR